MGETDKGGQNVQSSSYKINNLCRINALIQCDNWDSQVAQW